MKNQNIEFISELAHNVHRQYCAEIGQPTQPEWSLVSEEHKAVVMNSVSKILDGAIQSKSQSHENFVDLKKSQGWTYGLEYSAEKKTNPRLCEYAGLPPQQKLIETIFFTIVSSFK